MAERETRAERRRINREQPQGRQRWIKPLIGVGTAFLIATGGASYYYIDQHSPYVISSEQRIPLVKAAIEAEGIGFSFKEKDLWEKAANSIDTRLNLLKETMYASEVSDFKPTAERFDELISKGILSLRILTNAPSGSTKATTGVEVTEGKITLELSASVAYIQQQPLWATAIDFVHERKHIEDFLAFDSKNQELTDDQRRAALKDLMGTTRKNLDIEAPAYAEQIKAFLRFSALTGLNTSDTLFLPMTAQYVRVNNNYHHPKFEAYLVTGGYIH